MCVQEGLSLVSPKKYGSHIGVFKIECKGTMQGEADVSPTRTLPIGFNGAQKEGGCSPERKTSHTESRGPNYLHVTDSLIV